MIQMHGDGGLYPPYNVQVVFRTRDEHVYTGETVRTHDAGSSRSEPAFYVKSINKLFLALDVVEWQLSECLQGLPVLGGLLAWCN